MTEYTPDLHLEQLLSGLSPAGFPAGSSAPNHNEWSHQQQEAPVSASVSLPHVHPFTQDMQIDPFLLMDAPQPVQQEETRMAKRKSPEPQPQQSAPPAKSTTSRTQRMGPTTTVLPHIGRIRRLQRTSKGRYRTIERPVLSEDLTNALLQGEGEQHDQAVETLREAGTLWVSFFQETSLYLTPLEKGNTARPSSIAPEWLNNRFKGPSPS